MTPIPPLDRTSPTFRADVDTLFQTRIPLFVTEANALESQLEGALASEQAAAQSAIDAQAAANSASQVAGAVKWASGAIYAEGATVWSPLNGVTYRRRTAGSSAVDPSADSTNWALPIANGFTRLAVISTTQSWVAPAGVVLAEITVVDGGQGGLSNTGGSVTDYSRGGAGGKTGIATRVITPGASYTATIGAGSSTGSAPSDGGASSFSGSGITTLTTANATLIIPGGAGEQGGTGSSGGGAGGGTFIAPSGSAALGAGGKGGSSGSAGQSGANGVIIIRY